MGAELHFEAGVGRGVVACACRVVGTRRRDRWTTEFLTRGAIAAGYRGATDGSGARALNADRLHVARKK